MIKVSLHRVLWWLALIVLLVPLLGVSVTRAQQLPETLPAPEAGPTSLEEVQLYAEDEQKLIGRISIPDPKLAVLVQPEGREWRGFRNTILRIVSAILIVGIIAVLAIFYWKRGKIRIEHGRSGRTVTRFNGVERFAHWLTAVSFILLALTGLAILYGRPLLIPIVGHEAFTWFVSWGKVIHNFLSFPFVLGVVMMLVLWIRDNIPERADITWIRQGGGFRAKGPHPEAGRFNAGQKVVFWMVVLGGLGLAVSGYMLMFPFYFTGVGGMQTAHIVHSVLAAIMITMIIGHIYIGTLGMEGAFDAMGSGQVDENWAREHHSRWLEEEKRRHGGASTGPDLGHRAGAE